MLKEPSYNGKFSVEGVLRHSEEEGNGVRAWVVESQNGLLKAWDVQSASQETILSEVTLQKGDVLDFAVGSKGNVNHDSFKWEIKILQY